MFGIFLSAIYTAFGFVFRSIIVKFLVFFGVFYVVQEFIQVVLPMMPNTLGIANSLANMPSGIWYFLDLFNFTYGFPLVLSAFASRFIIRRIPFIG